VAEVRSYCLQIKTEDRHNKKIECVNNIPNVTRINLLPAFPVYEPSTPHFLPRHRQECEILLCRVIWVSSGSSLRSMSCSIIRKENAIWRSDLRILQRCHICCLPEYDAVQCGTRAPRFQTNTLPPSSGTPRCLVSLNRRYSTIRIHGAIFLKTTIFMEWKWLRTEYW
jgi:hypothetical protein